MAEQKNKKPWYGRWWAIIFYIFVGLIILGGIFGNNTPNNSVNSNDNDVTTQIQTPSQSVTYNVGDSIQAGDFTWKVTKITTAKQIGQEIMDTFFGKKADGIFIILDVEVENTDKSANYLTDSYLKLVDNQNREFSPDSTAAIYLKPEGSALLFEQVNPGIVKKGKIVFDVPQNVKEFNLKITSSLLSSKVYNMKISI